jgi:2,4-dienoyl-CoA reductase-like NADH-dependent reductase (Old Yellow Enzyme family)
MTTWSSNEDGSISNQEIDYYRLRARNVGMLITAAAHVLPVGQGFPRQLGAHCDDKIPSLKNLITTIQIQCASGVLQIFHAGRMRSPDILPMMQPVSASSIPAEHEGAVAPHEMTEYEILDTIEAFGEATHRAMKAGFNGVEIHGANGFLIQQFFSPHTNRRTDKWGGSLEKRMAFPLAVVDEVKEVIADYATWRFIVGYRLSPEEVWNQGITMDDTLQLVDALAKKKLDYLHVSTPDFWGGSLRDENDKKPRAVLIHERVGDRIPIIGVGSIRTPDDVVKVMDTGIPLVALGRELIMEPYSPFPIPHSPLFPR